MADDKLRRLERAAMSTPDDMEAFLRWRAELQRVQPSAYPVEDRTVRKITRADCASGRYDVCDGEAVILVDATAGPVAVRLQRCRTGRQVVVKKTDPTDNVVSVYGTEASETIDGSNGVVLSMQFESRTVVSDGSVWLIV